jgi:hypothetical protein
MRFGLFAMAVAAGFVDARHRKPARRFNDVEAMRVVALNAIHLTFQHRMMLWQMELGIRRNVTLKAGFRLFARVEDEFSATTAGSDVFAPGAMTRFATLLARHFCVGQMQPRMRARRKCARDWLMTIRACFVTNVTGAFNLRRGHHGSLKRRAGVKKHDRSRCDHEQEQGNNDAFH